MALGARSDPFLAFNFVVEIQSLVLGGFSDVTGLQKEIEVQDYREGGVNDYIHKLSGPYTLSHPPWPSVTRIEWFTGGLDALAQTAGPPDFQRIHLRPLTQAEMLLERKAAEVRAS